MKAQTKNLLKFQNMTILGLHESKEQRWLWRTKMGSLYRICILPRTTIFPYEYLKLLFHDRIDDPSVDSKNSHNRACIYLYFRVFERNKNPITQHISLFTYANRKKSPILWHLLPRDQIFYPKSRKRTNLHFGVLNYSAMLSPWIFLFFHN